MILYCRNEENKELYKETKTVVGRRCLTLKNIPQVLDSFLESSRKLILPALLFIQKETKEFDIFSLLYMLITNLILAQSLKGFCAERKVAKFVLSTSRQVY